MVTNKLIKFLFQTSLYFLTISISFSFINIKNAEQPKEKEKEIEGFWLLEEEGQKEKNDACFLGICSYDAEKEDIKQLLDRFKGEDTFGFGKNIYTDSRVCGSYEDIENFVGERRNYLKKDKNNNIVLVVSGYKNDGQYIAELTNKYKVHSIILLDPTVKKAIWEKGRLFRSRFSGFESIKFNYEKITNRIYNFYGEGTHAYSGYRKIEPELTVQMDPGFRYFLKAANIKCITNQNDCLYYKFDFWRSVSNSLIYSDYPFTNRGKLLLEKMPNLIKEIDEYRLNTDLTCFFCYEKEGAEWGCNQEDLIIPKGKSPLVVINRFTILDKDKELKYMVAKGKGVLGDTIWTSKDSRFSPRSLKQVALVQKQLREEGHKNAKKMKENPFLPVAGTLLWNKSALYATFLSGARGALGYILTGWLPSTKVELWDNLKEEDLILNNEYQDRIAEARKSNELCYEENAYKQAREEKVKPNLENLLKLGKNKNLKECPTIAIVGSGGGIRAMLTMLGSLKGLQDIGILGCATYISALSGSTWATALWMSTAAEKNLDQKKSLDEVIKHTIDNIRVTNLIDQAKTEYFAKKYHKSIYVKNAFGQKATLVDWWGRVIASGLFDELGIGANALLTNQKKVLRIDKSFFPIPIYTAVNINKMEDIRFEEGQRQPSLVKEDEEGREIAKSSAEGKKWYEFTPYEVGGDWLGAYIPTWSLGRKFAYGYSQDQAPEQTLGCFLGVFGSAIGASYEDAMGKSWFAEKLGLLDKRLTKARFYNFTYGMLPQGATENIQTQEYMDMVDAGVAINLPYPPISGKRKDADDKSVRKADIIIFVDASDDQNNPGGELRKVAKWAKQNNLEFPNLPPELRKEAVEVIAPQVGKRNMPLVIYVPLTKDNDLWNKESGNFEAHLKDEIDKNYAKDIIKQINEFDYNKCMQNECSTTNFEYTKRQSDRLIRLMQFNIWANKSTLKDAIKGYIESDGRKERFLQ